MPPNSENCPVDMQIIDKLNYHLSNIQAIQLNVARHRSLQVQHAAKVEAAAAKLAESAPVQTVRKRLCEDADAESLVLGVEAETARLEAEVEKVRKEVQTAQAWAESKWPEAERVLKEVERLTKAALQGRREMMRLRVETERVHKLGGKTKAETKNMSEEEEGSKDYLSVKQEMRNLGLELKRMNDEANTIQYEVFRLMAEIGRLGIEAERLRAEVDQLAWMTLADSQKAARD